MLSASMIVGVIVVGVVIARYLKSTRIMPDVETFIVNTGLLGAFVGVALLQVIITLVNNNILTLFCTMAIIYIGFCAAYDVIENYRKHSSNKMDAVKSIIIG